MEWFGNLVLNGMKSYMHKETGQYWNEDMWKKEETDTEMCKGLVNLGRIELTSLLCTRASLTFMYNILATSLVPGNQGPLVI